MHNRINLLAPATARNTAPAPQGANKIIIIICLVCVIAATGFYGIIFMSDYNTRTKVQETYREIARLGEVDKQARERAGVAMEISRTKANLDRLNQARPKLSKNLDEINRLIPVGVDLTKLEFTNSPFKADIKGTAYSPIKIAQFASNLQQSETFRNCVVDSTRSVLNERNKNSFSISITSETKGGSR